MVIETSPSVTTPSPHPKNAGDKDPSFGTNGIIGIPEPLSFLDIASLAVEPTTDVEQKLYISCRDKQAHNWIVRLLENGTIDESFGEAGYTSIPESQKSGSSFTVYEFIFLESGSMIAIGSVMTQIHGQIFFAPAATCITSDGVIDTSFGDEGFVVFELPLPANRSSGQTTGSESDFKQALSRNREYSQKSLGVSNGRARKVKSSELLFVGSIKDQWNEHIGSYIVKINPDGTLDKNFGQEGCVLIEDMSESTARRVDCGHYDVDRQGGIVVLGVNRIMGEPTETVAFKYDANGVPDRGFGESGMVQIINPYGFSSEAHGVTALDDGRVIILASFFTAQFIYKVPAVMKLTPAGNPDPSFNNGEPATVDLTPLSYFAFDMTIDDGQRIVIVGRAVGIGVNDSACASRIMPNGILDEEYGTHGTMMYKEHSEFLTAMTHSGIKVVGFLSRFNQTQASYVFRLLG